MKLVETCGSDIQLEGIPQCKSLKFPCFRKWVRSVVMTLSSECIVMGRRQGAENQISWKLLWGGPFSLQGKGLVYVANRQCWAKPLSLAWEVNLLFIFFVIWEQENEDLQQTKVSIMYPNTNSLAGVMGSLCSPLQSLSKIWLHVFFRLHCTGTRVNSWLQLGFQQAGMRGVHADLFSMDSTLLLLQKVWCYIPV